ncbi:fungal-specific transcription factor domain-containing protein [Dactylonectria estremocensis]|uniref:Fungal-specific transcription factor domain-containing protein n=1 Tax=Dactylonectria estremocensis TaxID=1079267 RepID=A0A9P9E1L2_9HYPO|nr:fungal-specific transcription factor domain-containing protein [Dactylonectria estremocensis]
MDEKFEHHAAAVEYRPVQRIDLACLECRHKKSRCSGHRPQCAHCRRLGRACQYPPASSRKPASTRSLCSGSTRGSGSTLGQAPPAAAGSSGPYSEESISSISERLSRIEDLLLELRAQGLGSYRGPDVASSSASRPSPTPSSLTGHAQATSSPSAASETGVAPFYPDGLPPRAVLLDCVDDFFRCCHNQPYSFFHEVSFRRSLDNGLLPGHLVLAVLASAVRFSSNPFFGRPHESAAQYANRSWKAIVSSCLAHNRAAHVQTVQTITLLAIFDFTAGKSRHGSAWVKIGLSVRIAQDLKLMVEDDASLPWPEREERRRVFWSVYLLDRLVSCGRCRPPAVLDASCQLLLPCDEPTYRSGHWQSTMTLEEFISRNPLPESVVRSPLAHVTLMAYALARAAGYMLQQFNARNHNPPWDAKSDFASIESDLLYVETALLPSKSAADIISSHRLPNGSIDQPSAGPGIFSMALFHLCHCLLYHPFLLRRRISSFRLGAPSSFLSRCFGSAWEHARAAIELLQEARQLGVVLQASFYGYCMVVAGSIMGLQCHNGQSWRAETSARLLVDSIDIAQHIGLYWNNVATMAIFLQRFVDRRAAYSQLASENPQTIGLSQADEYFMWFLVDYSTISNATEYGQQASTDLDQWGTMQSTWLDLFDTFSVDMTSDGSSQMVPSSLLGFPETLVMEMGSLPSEAHEDIL